MRHWCSSGKVLGNPSRYNANHSCKVIMCAFSPLLTWLPLRICLTVEGCSVLTRSNTYRSHYYQCTHRLSLAWPWQCATNQDREVISSHLELFSRKIQSHVKGYNSLPFRANNLWKRYFWACIRTVNEVFHSCTGCATKGDAPTCSFCKIFLFWWLHFHGISLNHSVLIQYFLLTL